jgi:hypothetical protein
MQITVKCGCGREFATKADNAGKRAKCSGCGNILTIPSAVIDDNVEDWLGPPTTNLQSNPRLNPPKVPAPVAAASPVAVLPPATNPTTTLPAGTQSAGPTKLAKRYSTLRVLVILYELAGAFCAVLLRSAQPMSCFKAAKLLELRAEQVGWMAHYPRGAE